ncbi:MAG: type IV pilus modification PilV family protein [Opitutales bacterium]
MKESKIPPSSKTRGSSGFSLIEVMVSLFIFSMAAVSLSAGLLTTRKLSEENIYQSTVLTVVTGFVEQAKSLNFAELESFADGNASSMDFLVSNNTLVSLQNDQETVVQIPIDTTDDSNRVITVDLYIRLKVSDVSDYEAVQVDIMYGYAAPLSQRFICSSVSTIISDVPTFS